MPRSSYSYKKKLKPDEEELRNKLKELAEAKPKYGYRMLHVLLKRKGYVINHKRTERLYAEEKLALRKKRKRRKTGSMYRTEVPKSERQNHVWSMDFVSDAVSSNRKLKMLTVVDTFTRKCLDILVDTSINGYRVCRVLDEIVEKEGIPEIIIVDNGPEFTGRALDEWAYRKGIKIYFIRPGKPVENAYIESFNGRLREECLNSHWFTSLDHARYIVSDWREDYNENRPHSSLGYLSPNEFIRKEASNQQHCVLEYSNS